MIMTEGLPEGRQPRVTRSIMEPMRRWDPERIGPYAIIGRLGAGAMGQVYLARSTAGRLVAVKTIRVELAEEPGFRARFAHEVAAARRVSGVFTAAVIEANAEADLPWVATAYVPAPSLSTLVRKCGPLPVPAVRWLAAGCAEALQSIHGVGLLHRDVKPSNVLVAPEGPLVIDFGVARAAERVQLTVTRGAAGTPAYMAPEQARDARQASPASDVFSLGATLVFAATGHPPYRGETVMDILVRLATEPPDLTGLPAELTGLIEACLERVPRDRPSDGAILQRLGSFDFVPSDAGPGHSYLPDSAMMLIAGYQHSPQLNGRADAEAADDDAVGEETAGSEIAAATGDATSGSHTALPGFDSPTAFGAGQGPPSRWAPRRRLRPGQRTGSRSAAHGRPLVWVASAVAAVALVAAGTAIGMSLRGSGTPASAPGLGPAAPPPCITPATSSGPELCVSQPFGDTATVYVIHGSGFVPGIPITVRLAGVGVSPEHPVADRHGTFNYAIDQGHNFFRGAILPGTYSAVVTAPGGRSASASFRVYPVGSAPSAPPSGQ